MRQEVNAWIRSDSNFDAIIDFDKAVRDPNNFAIINPPWDCGDGYHPNDLGNTQMVEAVDLRLFKP